DLVIGELGDDAAARQRFLSACGIYGVMLAVSQQGGSAGERSLPLLIADDDWDTLGDRIAELLGELEDQDVARLLLALRETLRGDLAPGQQPEVESITRYALGATRRAWHKQARPLPVFLVEAWYVTAAALPERVDPPSMTRTWTELHPSRSALVGGFSARDLQTLEEWLALAQILLAHDPAALARTAFHGDDQQLLAHVSVELGEVADPELRPLAESMLRRIRELSPEYRDLARTTLKRLTTRPEDQRWWVPQDIDAPPTTEPVVHERLGFTREDVERVLADL
ncbi:MAG: hypothetical protein JO325_00760, partial [Solirubrobacterales bacterium]|nr:hypothetical protein [Solirubrobacterales bacterium]